MPDPDPQPPQPRPIPVWKWMLLLLPAVPMILAPSVANAWSHAHGIRGEATMGPGIVAVLIAFGITVVSSIALGIQTEKWIHGSVQSLPRVLVNTLNIIFTACFVTWGGCALLAKYHIQ